MIQGLAMLRRYRRSWLHGDLLAGVTVAAYLVPQVMAYAQVAGLRPAAGLWAAVPALVIYAALGSSRSLSLGAGGDDRADDRDRDRAAGRREHVPVHGACHSLALLVGLMALIAGCCGWGSSRTCCRGRCWSATWPAWR